MNIKLIDIWLHRHAQSSIALLGVELGYDQRRHLFYLEWDYEKGVQWFELLFIKFK